MRSNKRVMQLAYGEMAPLALKTLLDKFQVCCVITPDPKINLYRSQPTLPVEAMAKKYHIPVIKDNSFSGLEKSIKKYQPDCVVIASYNKVIPNHILGQSKFINIHHGDLPRWRGRANINWAIILGKKYIGLTFHQAAPDLDAGNIYAQFKIPITALDTVKTVYAKVNQVIVKKLNAVVSKALSGYKGIKQRGKSTYCITRLPEDGLIDWTKTTLEINRLVRALTKPYPGAFTYFNDRKLIVWETQIPNHPRHYVSRIPGRISLIHPGKGVEVLTGNSSIIVTRVAYNGKEGLASDFITTVKASLGINWVKLYENSFRRP